MKKVMRIALATIIAALCVASLAMNVAGAIVPGQTPTGPSGVNYWALDTGSYQFQVRGYEYFEWETKDYGATSITGYTANYYHDLGGATLWSTNTPTPLFKYPDNDASLVVIQQMPDYLRQNPLKWVNAFQQYYAGANIVGSYPENPNVGSFTLSVSEIHLFDSATEKHVALYPDRGVTVLDSDNIPPSNFTQIWYVFDLPEGFGQVASEFQLRHISLNQETRVNQTYEDQVTTYIPYNQAWFGVEYPTEPGPSYQEGFQEGEAVGFDKGYEQGYQQGATDAGGEPIQRWGAFLITAVGGFLDFEIFPGFPLWGLLSACVAIPLAIAFLKLFAGG